MRRLLYVGCLAWELFLEIIHDATHPADDELRRRARAVLWELLKHIVGWTLIALSLPYWYGFLRHFP